MCLITLFEKLKKWHRREQFALRCSGGCFVAHVFEKYAFFSNCSQQGGSGNRSWQRRIIEKALVLRLFGSAPPARGIEPQVWGEKKPCRKSAEISGNQRKSAGVKAETLHKPKEGYIRTLSLWASPNISEFNSAGSFVQTELFSPRPKFGRS